MSKETSFLCLPEDFDGKFLIYPPKIKEVVGNQLFWQYKHLITVSHEELEDEFVNKKDEKGNPVRIPTPLEYLLSNSYYNKEFEKIAKQAFYFFTHQEVDFLYDKKLIIVGNLKKELKRVKKLEDLVFLTEDDYFNFQNKVRESLGEKTIDPPNPNEHPKIKRMKALARYRDKIKAKQGDGLKLITSLASICCMGLGITPLNIGEMSYASIGTLISTYQYKEKYEIDVRSLQAGADSKKVKPKYWITNLD